ncbi:MAG: rod shape-determining protein MreC [Anaerolineaceae bacterium]|nr:rod shape-determining protein MreC [Anaerolineaceae bacterium]
MKLKFKIRNWQVGVIMLIFIGIILMAAGGLLRPMLNQAISPFVSIQGVFAERFLGVYELLTLPRDTTELLERNNELEDEIARLQTENIQYKQQLREADILYALLDFAREKPENKYIAASVIGRDPSPFLQYIIIDHGSDDGLQRGMPVVTNQGLVGRIDAVTAVAARVQLISDPDSTVNVWLAESQTDAILTGSVTADLYLDMISQEINLSVGEILFTSGLGGNYPKDIVIGEITNVRKRENELFQIASVQPSVDFDSLRAVLVITNFRPTDLSPLEPEGTQ